MQHELKEICEIKATMVHLPGYQPAMGLVFEQLLRWTNYRTETTQPSQTAIAAAQNLARETVCRAVGWLRRWGYVRTRQRMIRQDDGTVLHGTLIYWVSKDVMQAVYLRGKALKERYRRYRALMASGAKRSTWQPPDQGLRERLILDGLRKSRCDVGVTTPSRPVYNSESEKADDKNLASPALQRLLKEKRWRS